ncbi:MAG: hypothetical protein ACT6FG_00485 [Methanosarcinaceae archaeon]
MDICEVLDDYITVKISEASLNTHSGLTSQRRTQIKIEGHREMDIAPGMQDWI